MQSILIQVGSRKNISCAYQIVIPHIILMQSLEWNSSPNVNFKGYEKAFDNVNRICLQKLPRYYTIPEKITSTIHSELLQRIDMQSSAQRSTHKTPFPRVNRCETRLLAITFPVPQRDRLDYEINHIAKNHSGPVFSAPG